MAQYQSQYDNQLQRARTATVPYGAEYIRQYHATMAKISNDPTYDGCTYLFMQYRVEKALFYFFECGRNAMPAYPFIEPNPFPIAESVQVTALQQPQIGGATIKPSARADHNVIDQDGKKRRMTSDSQEPFRLSKRARLVDHDDDSFPDTFIPTTSTSLATSFEAEESDTVRNKTGRKVLSSKPSRRSAVPSEDASILPDHQGNAITSQMGTTVPQPTPKRTVRTVNTKAPRLRNSMRSSIEVDSPSIPRITSDDNIEEVDAHTFTKDGDQAIPMSPILLRVADGDIARLDVSMHEPA